MTSASPCGGGRAVYSESTTIVPAADGSFVHLLGTGTPVVPPGLGFAVFIDLRINNATD